MENKWLLPLSLASVFSFVWVGWFTDLGVAPSIAAALITTLFIIFWQAAFSRTQPRLNKKLVLRAAFSKIGLILIVPAYFLISVLVLHPDYLPHRMAYDFIANRNVTLRLVDASLVKVEPWEIAGIQKEVLFVHPSSTGTTTLVYPIAIPKGAVFVSDVALAPGSWAAEGDGVVFSFYIENASGIHLLYSRYVDPKHQQQDQNWIPVRIDLSDYSDQIVRVILSVNSGHAGDARFDWSGWANPKLEQWIGSW
jgi:hypothetical protein